MNYLLAYGGGERFFTLAQAYPDLSLARVISQYKDYYKIITEEGEQLAEVSGKFRYEASALSDYPAVGDFVMVKCAASGSGNATIHHVLARKSAFERAAVGMDNQLQIVAANIDYALICMSLNQDYNLSRLERYLSVAWDSRAIPVVVLTKSDLCEQLPQRLEEISAVAPGVDVVVTSRFAQDTREKLLAYLKQGITASFIGSSGVGKSTLINLLTGEERLATANVRQEDDKGRHTTTRRELIALAQGGVVIDTPGMRELGVQSVNLSKSFADIDALLDQCRFHDCTHRQEPGCAIRAALKDGSLDARRFENYQKLKREARYDGLSSKQIETEKLNGMFDGVGGMKKARKYLREKDKRR